MRVLRPFLSLVAASAATTIGASLVLPAAVRHRNASAAGVASDPTSDLLMFIGSAVLALAVATLVIHWLGVFVVGGIHLVLGGLAVLVPTGGVLSGAYSPIFEIASMLRGLDRDLGDGALIFSFSGVEFALGAFLVAAALAVRTRQDSEPTSRPAATLASLVGAVVLGGSFALLLTVGGDFTTSLFSFIRYDTLLAFGVALAAVLAGIAGLTLRWASSGVLVIGALTLVAGFIAYVALDLFGVVPLWLAQTPLVAYGFSIPLGLCVVVACLVATVAPRRQVPAFDDDL